MRKRCTQGTSRLYEYVREMELGKKLYCPSQGTSIYTVMVQRERYRLACIALLHYSVDLLSGCGQWRLFSRLIPIDHCSYHSNEVASIRSGSIPPCLFLLSTGSSRISTPGPTVLADDLCLGNIYKTRQGVSLLSIPQMSTKASEWFDKAAWLWLFAMPAPPITCPTYLRSAPSPSKGNLMCQQLAQPKHHPIDKRQQQIDRRTPY